ncbi:uncharacterized protein [Nicotiana sylvestris]|uniref:uncharacterized protein n=1 Tax=Nicotiana sylvestris TaxID=4096 RepID=UPI00388CCDA9
MDVGILLKRKKRFVRGQSRIRWGALSKDNAQELEGCLMNMGAWKNGGDASAMWTMMAKYIREASRKALGILKGYSGGHRGGWWWNDVVQGKMEAKRAAYIKLLESTDKDQRRANREGYKEAWKEAKLAVTKAKMLFLVGFMRNLGAKVGTRSYFDWPKRGRRRLATWIK